MNLEAELHELLRDARPSPAQERDLLAVAYADARRRERRRRAGSLLSAPVGLAAVLAAVIVTALVVNGPDSRTSRPDGEAVINAAPGPSVAVPPNAPDTPAAPITASPLPALPYQSVPGVSTARAATIVDRCVAWRGGASAYVDAGQARLENLTANALGSVAVIDGPVRSGTTPPGSRPTAGRTLLVVCWLLPDDTVDTLVYQQVRYADHALPGPVLTEVSRDGVVHVEASKTRGSASTSPRMSVVTGRVARSVARLEWTTADGQRRTAQILNGYFLATSIDRGVVPNGMDAIRAYDRAGHPVAITDYGTGAVATPVYWP